MVKSDPLFVQQVDQFEHLVERGQKRIERRDLRADVAVNTGHPQVRERDRAPVGRERVLVRDTELVFAQARRDVGVGTGVDVGIDPQGHRRANAH